jgi:transcriptional regulator with XRE-family HTH domain
MDQISKKIRAARLANGMTLKQLAVKAKCTDAYLSQLERGRANPSIMILKNVASALGLKIVDFFFDPEEEENDVVLHEKERVNINFKEGNAKIQMLVRDLRDKRMQPFYNVIKPGGGSKGSYSHVGEEFGIVLEGQMEIILNGEAYRLKKNDSFYFSSQTLHSWSNPGKRKTIIVWVTSPPTF